MAESATGLPRLPPMLKDEASALDYAGRMAYADSVHPPTRDVGVPVTIAYDAWYITADASMPEAGFGLGVRYFVAPNITSGYWKNRGATHIRRFPIPTSEQEIRDPDISYTKPKEPTPSPETNPDAIAALKTALLLAVKAVECLEQPGPTDATTTRADLPGGTFQPGPEAPPTEDPDNPNSTDQVDNIFDSPLDPSEVPA